jgi:hypothetical protein
MGTSQKKMNILRTFLRDRNFHIASKNECKKLLNALKLPEQRFDTFTIYDNVRYTWTEPLEILDHLVEQYKGQGANIIGRGGSLSVNIQIDKGGGETKMIMQLGCPSIPGQHSAFLMGKYVGDDDYFHLKAFMKNFIKGFWDISYAAIIQIANEKAWDFVIVDTRTYPSPRQDASTSHSTTSHSSSSTSHSSSGLRITRASSKNPVIKLSDMPEGLQLGCDDSGHVVVLAGEKVLKTLSLKMNDINTDVSILYNRLDMFLSGDCQALCTLLGMQNASGHYCLLCNANKKQMQDRSCRLEKVTIEARQNRLRQPIAKGSKIFQLEPILPMIPIENVIVSLHLRLGTASFSVENLVDSGKVFDIANHPELSAANSKVSAAQLEEEQCESDVIDARNEVNELSASNSRKNLCPPGAFRKAHDHLITLTSTQAKTAEDLRKENAKVISKYDFQRVETKNNRIAQLTASLANQNKDIAKARGDYKDARDKHMSHHPNLILESADSSLFDEEELQVCREASERIRSSSTDLQTAERKLQQCQAAYSASIDAHKRASEEYNRSVIRLKNVSNTVVKEIYAVLRKCGIKPAHWFGGSALQGRSTFNLFHRAHQYLPEIEKIIQSSLRQDATEQERAVFEKNLHEWRTFATHFEKLMQSAAIIFPTVESVTLMTEEQQRVLVDKIRIFQEEWDALSWSVTPKCHMITAHLADDAIRTQLYGIFSESVVERVHFLCKLYRPRTHNTGDWKECERRLYRLMGILSNPDVTKRLNEIVGIDRTVKYATSDACRKSGLALNTPSLIGKREIQQISGKAPN